MVGPDTLVALAAIVVAGQVVATAAVAVALAGIALLTTATLLVPATPGLPGDDRDLDRGGEPRVNALAGSLAAQPLQAIIACGAGIVLVARAVVAIVPGLGLLLETTKTQQCQRAAQGGLDHAAAVGLLAHLPRQIIESLVIHSVSLSTVNMQLIVKSAFLTRDGAPSAPVDRSAGNTLVRSRPAPSSEAPCSEVGPLVGTSFRALPHLRLVYCGATRIGPDGTLENRKQPVRLLRISCEPAGNGVRELQSSGVYHPDEEGTRYHGAATIRKHLRTWERL